MLLCLDVGNTQLFGGVFNQDTILLRFRYESKATSTSDQLGIFLKSVLRENELDPKSITAIAISSVVPSFDYSLRAACLKYFNIEPFLLSTEVNTGLKINYRAEEIGADRLANAIAATHFFAGDVIVVDLGTATTLDVINAKKEYLGGAILPGIRLSMEALESKTAKLPSVEIVQPQKALGQSTQENLQSGLYYGQVGMIRELSQRIMQEAFEGRQVPIIGTGGFAYLFEKEGIFAKILPDLVLQGLRLAMQAN